MPSGSEAHPAMQQFNDKIEEIRTICRLHALPTGQWENLVDLPFRLSQDSGLRSDLVEIVRSLQRGSLHLPDVLDLMVLAVGGPTAPKHSRELSEPLNQIGGFLSSVGRWPDTDTRPILAPGEVPENIEKFTRPQPRLRPVPPPPPAPEPSAPAPQPELVARPVRLFEARPRRSPATSDSSPSQPIQPDLHRAKPDRPQPPSEPSPEQPVQASTTFNPPEPEPRKSADLDTSTSSGLNLGKSTLLPEGDISQALGRLERGNLELRAHLDSIDQRISRMEPLLESGTPLPDLSDLRAALTDLTTSTSELPLLLHRESSPRDPLRTEPLHVEPLRPRPLRPSHPDPEPIRSDPLRSDPSPGNSSAPTSARARFRADRLSDTAAETPVRAFAEEPAQRSVQGSETSDPPRKSSGPVQLPVAPRFSRFSRDPSSTDPVPLESRSETRPLTGPAAPLPIASRPGPELASPPDQPRPMALPRGFFGTIPEPDEATIDMAVDPPHRRRRFGLIVTVLILLGLIAAAVALYMRSIAPDANASTITPVPAPRTPGVSRSPASTSPAPSSTGVRSTSAGSYAPVARGASQPRETLAQPVATNGFRPAPNFVPASVMDGHLVAAPMPSQPRVPASSGTQAIVVMEVNISSTGQVEDLYVLGGSAALRPAAINAVRNWRYKPYTLNGTPTEVRTVVRVDFSEHRSQPADRGAPFPR